ncbi:MAG: efflux RND transporter periplasmic adaptor subunit [Bacteroidota bacterium]|nr:efflux RND transporter periplasmic adaptor subunit [Bacteroidota bacterium]
MKRINRFQINFIAIILATALFTQSCKKANAAPETDSSKYVLADSLVRTLKFDSIQNCQMTNTITLTGKVSFNDDHVVKIYPMVSGVIQNIKVLLGDYVHKGQVLAVIKSSEMAGYGNDLVTAESNLRVAKKNLDATRDMFKSGLASQKELLSAEAASEQAQSELSRVKRVLHINGGNTNGDYIVRSPINGFVVEKMATNDMSIRTDNSTNLFTISDLKNVWIIANVYESNISMVHLNDVVDVTTLSYPGKVFKGKVDKMMNVLDPTNKVMKVRIVLPNPGYVLKPEMFANVKVTNEENHNALCVSSSAVIFDHSQNYILVYHSKADIKIIPVEVINTVGDRTYISGNIHTGDKVIASQAILIYDTLNN